MKLSERGSFLTPCNLVVYIIRCNLPVDCNLSSDLIRLCFSNVRIDYAINLFINCGIYKLDIYIDIARKLSVPSITLCKKKIQKKFKIYY